MAKRKKANYPSPCEKCERKKAFFLYDFGELFRAYDKYEVIGNIHDNPELLEG